MSKCCVEWPLLKVGNVAQLHGDISLYELLAGVLSDSRLCLVVLRVSGFQQSNSVIGRVSKDDS